MAIPYKLGYIQETKNQIANKLQLTGQNTFNKTFREYNDLIENIPFTGVISKEQLDFAVNLAIEISGEKA